MRRKRNLNMQIMLFFNKLTVLLDFQRLFFVLGIFLARFVFDNNVHKRLRYTVKKTPVLGCAIPVLGVKLKRR